MLQYETVKKKAEATLPRPFDFHRRNREIEYLMFQELRLVYNERLQEKYFPDSESNNISSCKNY